MTGRVEYNYHVYGLAKGRSRENRKYVADGPSCKDEEPIIESGVSKLARELCLFHWNDRMDRGVSKGDRVEYLGVSFVPPCDNVFHAGQFHRVQPLTDDERRRFLTNFKRHVKELMQMRGY